MVDQAVLLTDACCATLERTARAGPHNARLALLPIANEPLLVHVARSVEAAGMSELLVVVAPALRAELAAILDAAGPWRLRVAYLEAEGPLARLIGAAARGLAERPFLLHLGDSIAKPGALAALLGRAREGPRDALVAVERQPARRDLRVVQLAAASRRVAERRLGMYVLGRDALAAAADHADRDLAPCADADAATHADRDAELLAMIEQLASDGGTVERHPLDGCWRHRPAADAVLEANRFALEGQDAEYDPETVGDSRIEGAVVVHETARMSSCVVRGPSIIGPRAELSDAYVGPYTAVGPDVRIDGAEIENSILLPGACVSQLGCRLEASVIGAGARVRRDFRLPRALRLDIGSEARISVA